MKSSPANFDQDALAMGLPIVLADAARLIGLHALAAEGAARRGELSGFIDLMQRVAAALDEIRETFVMGSSRK